MPDQVLLTVAYTGELDVVYELREQHQVLTFGRDETRCNIVIWSAINGSDLSRVAGQIWRMGDELWFRNLSTRHELYLEVPGHPSIDPLPPRTPSGADPGWARSIPAPLAYIQAPGGCELEVRQQRDAAAPASDLDVAGTDTVRAPEVPERLLPIAAALCEPLFSGGRLPATYSEISRRIGEASIKRVRNLVGELRDLYVREIPQLWEKVRERQRREDAELRVRGVPTLHHGVWVYPTPDDRPSDVPDGPAAPAMALPDYYEVAYLLVRRRLITASDVGRLLYQKQDGRHSS
jgi:hypothetical protein